MASTSTAVYFHYGGREEEEEEEKKKRSTVSRSLARRRLPIAMPQSIRPFCPMACLRLPQQCRRNSPGFFIIGPVWLPTSDLLLLRCDS